MPVSPNDSASLFLTLGDLKPGWWVDGKGDLRGETNPKKVITYLEDVDEGH